MRWLALKVSLHQNRFLAWKLEAMGSYSDGAFLFLFHSKVEQNDIELCSVEFINPVYDAQMKFLSRTEKSYDRSLKFLISWRLQFPKRLNVFCAKSELRSLIFALTIFVEGTSTAISCFHDFLLKSFESFSAKTGLKSFCKLYIWLTTSRQIIGIAAGTWTAYGCCCCCKSWVIFCPIRTKIPELELSWSGKPKCLINLIMIVHDHK